MKIRPTVTLVQSIVLACSVLFSGCSQVAVPASTTVTSTSSIATTTSEVTTTTSESYAFTWEFYDTEEFEKIIRKKFNTSITSYIVYYGFSEEFCDEFDKYVSNKLGKTCKDVPLKKANYFFDLIMKDTNMRHRYDDYETFKHKCLNTDKAWLSTFNCKLIMSYFVQNQLSIGVRIQLENFKSLMGENSYVYTTPDKILVANPKTGNLDKSYKYNKYELNELLMRYNSITYTLAADNSIKTGNLFEKPEVIELYNKHLKKFYGEKAFQLGEVPTKEQYIAIYGEEPLDLSYIPGAVVGHVS